MFPATPHAVNLQKAARSTIGYLLSVCRRGLLPPCCLLCGGAGGADGIDLCIPCRRLLVRAAATELAPFAGVTCPWHYAWPLDRGVQAFKFQGERAWGRVFGVLLARERLAGARPLPELIVPVPLHHARQRTRGFNQSADIALDAARALRLSCVPHALERLRATGTQSTLPVAGRAVNVAGAFRATRALEGRRVALVDDVLTTGSTARAAAAALLASGAGAVELWVVARAGGAGAGADFAAAGYRRTAYSSITPPSTTMPK